MVPDPVNKIQKNCKQIMNAIKYVYKNFMGSGTCIKLPMVIYGYLCYTILRKV